VKAKQPEDLSTFGGRLTAAMDAIPVNGRALSIATGVDQGYISKLRSGERKMPNADIVERLAAYLGVRGAWLARGTEPRTGDVFTTTEDTRELHPLDAVLEESGWAASFGLTFEQATSVVEALEGLRTAAKAPVPRSVWRDERDKLARLARDRGGPKVAPPSHDETPAERDAGELAEEKARRLSTTRRA